MKNINYLTWIIICILYINGIYEINAQKSPLFKEIKGKVIDSDTKDILLFADVVIKDSNIGTITNSNGEFVLKVPDSLTSQFLTISHIGYQKKDLKISELSSKNDIVLSPSITQLKEVEVKSFKNAESLLRETLKKRNTAYLDDKTLLIAFYRETIKKRRKNASLSEAVVEIDKQSYSNFRDDAIRLIKARKNTDYDRLDTLALKLQGGPFSNLYTDIIKYPEYIFTIDDIPLYDFSFGKSTQINNKLIYVINFKQKPEINTPLYYGKLYIDSETLALTNAVYSLNVENKKLASDMYVRKKPNRVDVYPTEATYRVNYRIQNGKWSYAYSNILLTFKVNWKGKLFNSIYTLNSEMAVTDWRIDNSKLSKSKDNFLRPNTILTDEASGFSDPKFWGEYNIIEPEKSIESAIEKIIKQLNKSENI